MLHPKVQRLNHRKVYHTSLILQGKCAAATNKTFAKSVRAKLTPEEKLAAYELRKAKSNAYHRARSAAEAAGLSSTDAKQTGMLASAIVVGR